MGGLNIMSLNIQCINAVLRYLKKRYYYILCHSTILNYYINCYINPHIERVIQQKQQF